MRWRAAACLGAFAVGVAAGNLPLAAGVAVLLLWVAAAAALRAPHETPIRLMLAALVAAGLLAARLDTPRPQPAGIVAGLEHAPLEAWGDVDGFVDELAGGASALVRITAVRARGEAWRPVRLAALVRFPGAAAPQRGAGVHFTARFKAIRNLGLTGEYDRVTREARRGVFLDAWADPHWLTVREPGRLDVLLTAIRARALAAAGRELSDGAFGVFAGLAFGEQRRMPLPLRDAWRDAGVSHLVAISGLHLAIVFLVMRWIARRLLSLSERLLLAADVPFWSGMAALPAVAFYAVLSGSQAPTLRSLAMLVVAFAAQGIGRRVNGLEALCWGALGLLAVEPALLYHPGFELSFAAVFGAAAWQEGGGAGEPDRPRLERLRRYLAAAFLSTVVATLWTSPIAAYHFGRVSPAGLVANIPLIPFVSVVLTPAAFAYAVAAAAAPEFPWPWVVLEYGLSTANGLVAFFAAAPYAGLDFRLDLTETLLFMALVGLAGLAVLTPHVRWRRRAGAAVVLAVLLGVWHEQRRAARYDVPLRVDVLAIGQGDAVLVTSQGRHVLIDTGGDERTYRRYLRPFLIAERAGLEALVLTHPHEDHVGGAAALIADLRPARVVVPSRAHFAAARPEIAAAAARSGVPVEEWTAGEEHALGAARLRVLHPAAPFRNAFPLTGGNWNDLSLVLEAAVPGHCALLPGDAEHEAERALVESDRLRACELLKAPHHGSRTSSARELLERVRPQWAFVSAGYRNSFGHPHISTLNRWEQLGIRWRNTAEEGTLTWIPEANLLESHIETSWRGLSPSK